MTKHLYVVEYKSRRGTEWRPIPNHAHKSPRRAALVKREHQQWGGSQYEYRVAVYGRIKP